MADEQEPAAPVEDPIKPGAEGEQEPKAEEPTEETPEPEGGAATEQEGEEEVEPADALKSVIEGMDPEERRALYDTAYESLSDEEKDGLRPEAVAEKANAEASLRERDVAMSELAETRKNRDDTFQAATEAHTADWSATQLYDDQGNKMASPDKKAFAGQRSDAYLQGQITWDEQLRGAIGLQLLTVMEENGIKITPEMKKLGTSIGNNSMEWLRGTVGEGYATAKSSAPDSIKVQAKEAAEKEAGVAAQRTKLVEALGGRRKKKALAGGGAANGIATLEQAHMAHAKGDITTKRMREYQRQFSREE